MPTKNPRINISLEKTMYDIISEIAKRKGISMSMVTRDLIKEAIETSEDVWLTRFAEERERTLHRDKSLTHEEAWG
jgi:metal-responsive CopG/Arc/MetJ family transcriptional regulator